MGSSRLAEAAKALTAGVALTVLAACGGSGGTTIDGSDTSSSSGGSTTAAASTGTASGGGDMATSGSTTASGVGGAGSGTGGAATSGSASGGGGVGGAGQGGAGEGGRAPVGLATLGTLVVLGDSISDGGGSSPYYYDLLKADLQAHYGNIAYHNKAESGSTTGALVSQIQSLPGALAGPVAVTITSGGNDMKAALPLVLLGIDGAAKTTMGGQIGAALDLLLTPGKFGAGVEVHVYEGNIYDASDGVGDFGSHGCAFGSGIPTIATDAFFAAWNQVIGDEIAAHGQVSADMHGYFYGHGYASSPSWYASDCTHPSATGHSELRNLFYAKITGAVGP